MRSKKQQLGGAPTTVHNTSSTVPSSTFPPSIVPSNTVVNSYAALLREVRAAGLMERRRGFYVSTFAVLLAVLAFCWLALAVLDPSWYLLLLAPVLGVVFTQFAFLAHEASHHQIFASARVNEWCARVLGVALVGVSYAWWTDKHGRHHKNPNSVGKDPDIEFDAIHFTEERAATRRGLKAALTRRQGYLFFPLLLLEGLSLHLKSVQYLAGRSRVQWRWLELALMAARFALYAGALFWLLPPVLALAFIAVQFAVFGLYMGASFAPNHKGMPIIGRDQRVDFLTRQVLTSRNIRGGWFINTLMGGLNYQIEHHLFPDMPRPQFRRAQQLVRDYCAGHNIAYTQTSLGRSYAIVVRYLNQVGLAARDPFECPLAARLRRW